MKDREKGASDIFGAVRKADICGGRDVLTLRGRCELTVCGCRRILLYSEERIKLLMHEYILVISGRELFCPSFKAGAVRVDGVIEGVSLEGAEK